MWLSPPSQTGQILSKVVKKPKKKSQKKVNQKFITRGIKILKSEKQALYLYRLLNPPKFL